MTNEAIISLLKKEVENNKGNYLEAGINHVLNLLQDKSKNEGNTQTQSEEEFRELLGKDIWIKDDYFCKKNVLYLGVASYRDKKGGMYYFNVDKKNNKKHMNSSPDSKRRIECLFKKDDIPQSFYHHLNKWIKNNSDKNLCLDFSNINSCYGKTCLIANYDEASGYFCLEEAFIQKGTMLHPLEVSSYSMSYSFPKEEIPTNEFNSMSWSNTRKSRLFAFNESDYNELITLLGRLYDSLY